LGFSLEAQNCGRVGLHEYCFDWMCLVLGFIYIHHSSTFPITWNT
jgi:hypothetical protein